MKVIIIGSGIVGATAAYYLSKNNVQVTLIDRNEPGRATDAAAGIICPWLAQRRNKAWYELARQGARIYPDLIEQLIADGAKETGYKRVGALGLHTVDKRLFAAEKRVLKRKENAPEIGDVILLNKKETAERFPLLEKDRFRSIYISGAARVNGKLLRKSLIHAAEKYGAVVIEGDAKLAHHDGKIYGVIVNDEVYEADFLIVVNGAWMKQLFTPVGIDLSVKPQKAQIIHLEVNDHSQSWPVIMPPNNQYILPIDENKIIVGATHETKAGFDRRVTAGGAHEILTNAIEIVPKLATSIFNLINDGFRPFTPNSLPVFGHLPGQENVLLANGLGASGLTTGPLIGIQLSKIILNKQSDLDPSPYQITNILVNGE